MLRHCIQDQKVPHSNPTVQSARHRDPTSLWGSQLPLGQIRNFKWVINIRLEKLPCCQSPNVGLGVATWMIKKKLTWSKIMLISNWFLFQWTFLVLNESKHLYKLRYRHGKHETIFQNTNTMLNIKQSRNNLLYPFQ